jgi:DNA-binding NarL/FixJ family response regulator
MRVLSRRELAIAHLVARGYANLRIAADLNISEGTVKGHLHRIYKKLGVTHRTALILCVQKETLPRLD